MKQVKFVPHQSQWTDEEFQAIVEDVENDIDGELKGAQITIATKIAEVKEQIAPLKATKATLDLMDSYRLDVKSGIRQLKLKLLNYEAILQKLAEMRRLYQSYLHVRDLPSSSPTKDEFVDIVPILSESQLRCFELLPTYPEYERLPELFRFLKKRFLVLMFQTFIGRDNKRSEEEQDIILNLLYDLTVITSFLK
ncbi:hypothetical protein TVAGG3_0345470 [Trichomonas vaginalis G3]|uniref:hypothetical protein n=3 Tax=Trichomonas vaginalis (strain ATCC PRA-98 / G3) TaxID=412133 RepID=UPI0021E5C541|nr:hypothetical protein TVAGG3_0345470 [Trichomonas vaginalis G3]KAI5530939.1 hypothetical protein TVAGG3_0345470 [Trichomonas vaginalis G3]